MVGGGFGVGLIGGVISFSLYIGPVFVLLLALVPAASDLQDLGPAASTTAAADAPPPWDQILERRPELGRVAEAARGDRLAEAIRARIFVGIFGGVALGMLVTLMTTTTLAVGGAAAAEFAVRRAGSVRGAVPLYLEVLTLLTLVVVALVVVVLCLSLDWKSHTLTLALWVLAATLGVFGTLAALGRWGQRERWAAYWLGFGGVALATELVVPGAHAIAILAVVLGRAAARGRRSRRPRDLATNPPAGSGGGHRAASEPTRTLTTPSGSPADRMPGGEPAAGGLTGDVSGH